MQIASQHGLLDLEIAFRDAIELRKLATERSRAREIENLRQQVSKLSILTKSTLAKSDGGQKTRDYDLPEVGLYAPPELWRASQAVLKQVNEAPSNDKSHLLVSALMMGFSAFESYVSFLAMRLSQRYESFRIARKVRAVDTLIEITNALGMTVPDRKSDGWALVVQLSEFRDALMHTHAIGSRSSKSRAFSVNAYLQTSQLSVSDVAVALSKLAAFLDQLHSAFEKQVERTQDKAFAWSPLGQVR